VEQNTSVKSVIVVHIVMKISFTSSFIFSTKSWTMIQKHKLSLLHRKKNIALKAQILVFTSWVMVQIVVSTLSLVVPSGFCLCVNTNILDSDSCRGFNNSTLCGDEEAEF
jgi:hypothetical protein